MLEEPHSARIGNYNPGKGKTSRRGGKKMKIKQFEQDQRVISGGQGGGKIQNAKNLFMPSKSLEHTRRGKNESGFGGPDKKRESKQRRRRKRRGKEL